MKKFFFALAVLMIVLAIFRLYQGQYARATYEVILAVAAYYFYRQEV